MGSHRPEEGTGFAVALKSLREKAGLSQQALADAAGMHVFGIAKLEQGLREPGWATVLKLAKALDVDCTAFAACTDAKGEAESEAKPAKKKAKK